MSADDNLHMLIISKDNTSSLDSLYCSVYCTPRNHHGTFATGKIRQNFKFAAFLCVFLTKIKVDPESC